MVRAGVVVGVATDADNQDGIVGADIDVTVPGPPGPLLPQALPVLSNAPLRNVAHPSVMPVRMSAVETVTVPKVGEDPAPYFELNEVQSEALRNPNVLPVASGKLLVSIVSCTKSVPESAIVSRLFADATL